MDLNWKEVTVAAGWNAGFSCSCTVWHCGIAVAGDCRAVAADCRAVAADFSPSRLRTTYSCTVSHRSSSLPTAGHDLTSPPCTAAGWYQQLRTRSGSQTIDPSLFQSNSWSAWCALCPFQTCCDHKGDSSQVVRKWLNDTSQVPQPILRSPHCDFGQSGLGLS